jgi:hypothetical protein
MPTTFCDTSKIAQAPNSPEFESSGLNSWMKRTYLIDAETEAAALVLLKGAAPATATVDTIPLEATPVYKIKTIRGLDGGVSRYEGTVDYRHAGRDEQTEAANELIEPGREKVSFSFSGASAHQTVCLSQTKYGTNSRDVGKALNVQYNGEVDGLEVNSRTGQFTVSTVIEAATATNAWFKARFEQVWTLNNATFRSWGAGSVALIGIDGRQRADGNWEIDYSFQIQPPETLTEIGGVSLGGSVAKEGWQYAWVMFRPKDDANKIVPEPIGAYIADIYPKTDFSLLGIST